MIPLLDSVVYPYFNKKFNKTICVNSRLVLGMCLSALSVIAGGLLETIRLDIIQQDPVNNTINQLIGNTTYIAANLHILWQIPQYMLIGLGEVFCSVCCVYYAYSASPKSMQSILMGLFYFFTGTGSFISSLILYLTKKYIFSSTANVDDINCPKCHLNYYFYLLASLQIVGVILFILIDSKYKIVKCNQKNNENINKVLLSPDITDQNIIDQTGYDEINQPFDASKTNYISNIENDEFNNRNINV
jgi:peptide/histidine transporter 3/4